MDRAQNDRVSFGPRGRRQRPDTGAAPEPGTVDSAVAVGRGAAASLAVVRAPSRAALARSLTFPYAGRERDETAAGAA